MDNLQQPPFPPWLHIRVRATQETEATRSRLRRHGLHTVCEAAACPNRSHCWSQGRATILILGENCTRSCRFCHIDGNPPFPPDPAEPQNVADAIAAAGLHDVVITSVTRDDLPDGGADHWVRTIQAIQNIKPAPFLEILVPDFAGNGDALDRVLHTSPSLFSHNLETIPRLYPSVRPEADYQRSLAVLHRAATAGLAVKTGVMLGLGETEEEIHALLQDARSAGCTHFCFGQYLQPSPSHLPVAAYIHPTQFESYRNYALSIGFADVVSTPLARTSYRA